VHYVVPELDSGPVILQAEVPVLAKDTPDTLAARVLEQEHKIYPQALKLIAQGQVRLHDGRVIHGPAVSAAISRRSRNR
jgi:phosphoribosylglycinamide formyltransferase-1